MFFLPGKIGMVVNFKGGNCAKNFQYFFDNHISAGISIFSGKVHSFKIVLAYWRIKIKQNEWSIHSAFLAMLVKFLSLRKRNKSGCGFVTKITGSKANTNPKKISVGKSRVYIIPNYLGKR